MAEHVAEHAHGGIHVVCAAWVADRCAHDAAVGRADKDVVVAVRALPAGVLDVLLALRRGQHAAHECAVGNSPDPQVLGRTAAVLGAHDVSEQISLLLRGQAHARIVHAAQAVQQRWPAANQRLRDGGPRHGKLQAQIIMTVACGVPAQHDSESVPLADGELVLPTSIRVIYGNIDQLPPVLLIHLATGALVFQPEEAAIRVGDLHEEEGRQQIGQRRSTQRASGAVGPWRLAQRRCRPGDSLIGLNSLHACW